MSFHYAACRLLRPRRIFPRSALFATVSVAALTAATPDVYARPLGGQASTPSAAAIAAAQSGQQEAARAASQASNSLKRATLAIQAQQASQQAARDAARTAANASAVPNGLGVGGLQRAAGAVPGTNLWQGADLPTQFADGDRVKVNIGQTQQKAILTWDTFNVGARTDLRFDQHGNRDWVSLNRVLGTDARPSQILGSIKADGSVYVINQNGIIFGGGSQINVGALIASTAKISNDQFLRGSYSTQTGSTWTPSFTDAAALLGNGTSGGVVSVEAGAQIQTHAPASVTSGGGFVLLMGGQVVNTGSIATPNGQTQFAAGDDFVLRRGYGTDQNIASTTRGNEIAPLFRAGSLAGLVRNDGIVFSSQGDITLAGRAIEQNGALLASTSVNTRGTIHLLNSATDTLGSVTLGAGSVTTVIPELESEETALDSQRDALIAASATANQQRSQSATGPFDNLSLLADRLDQSRIEIVTGGNVTFKGGVSPEAGSLTIAQGGQVAVSAAGRIFTEGGATVDVSGVRDVSLAMSANNIMVNIQGNELRDSPQNRDNNALKNADVWVDIRDLIYVPSGTGGYAGDRYYTPGGLLEVGGYLANTAHKIGEWSAVGGTITLSAPEVIAQAGSVFDISGGSVRYEAGNIRTTNFLGADGRLYNINDARADMTFYGLGQGFIRKHERWNVTEVWTSPFGKGRESVRWEEGYTVGRDAGRLILSTPTAIFEGNILADVVDGERQSTARPDGVADGYKFAQNVVAQAGTLALGQYSALGLTNAYATDVKFADMAAITAGLTSDTALPDERANTAYFDADHLGAQGLGGLSVATRGAISVDNDLTLADGAQVKLVAPTVDIKADITARSGSVSISSILTPDLTTASPIVLTAGGLAQLTLHSGATIDVRGLWINTLTNPNDLSGQAFLNSGNVAFNSTQNVTLAAGSVIDVSSGGAIVASGKTKGGKGGDVTLIADDPSASTPSRGGLLLLNADIKAYGVSGGGTLKIGAPSVLIAPAGAVAAAGQVVLAPDVFRTGFSNYSVNGYQGLVVAPGATLDVTMPVYRFTAGSFSVPSYSDPAIALEVWTPPLYQDNALKAELTQRGGASLTLESSDLARGRGKGYLEIGTGATLRVDPGQSIALQSPGQITVDGRLVAHSGRIDILQQNILGPSGPTAEPSPGARSIWIGEHAVLDVAARAVTALDANGRAYGVVPKGGTITIGAHTDQSVGGGSIAKAAESFVVIRPGALLDASGASAVIDLSAGMGAGLSPGVESSLVNVASDGGTIAISSYNGLYLDGTMKAVAGGKGAAGGTLALTLETPAYLATDNPPAAVRKVRELVISQRQTPSLLPDDLQAGDADPSLVFGAGRISVDQIEAGGFGNVSLLAREFFTFDGDVTLRTQQSVRLYQGYITNAPAGAHVTVAAPYVLLSGRTDVSTDFRVVPSLQRVGWTPSSLPAAAEFRVEADFIDIARTVRFGSKGTIPTTSTLIDRRGYDDVILSSRGDIRFLKGDGGVTTSLTTSGDLALIGAQVYPATQAQAEITVGLVDTYLGRFDPLRTVTISKAPGSDPEVPLSIQGRLAFTAPTVLQGGVVRAPLGSIIFKGAVTTNNAQYEGNTRLLAGSITSVSGAGLIMPYGGTVDGLSWKYDGADATKVSLGGVTGQSFDRGIQFNGKSFAVDSGAVLDLSGGGDLVGAGFISGRGGSVDVRTTALANANPANSYSSSGNRVYAIVPSRAGGYTPVATAESGGNPVIGQEITIPAGTPGLPAGTYTLLPSDYALLPGAFRVEIGAAERLLSGTTALPNGSYIVAARLGIAGTDIRNALSTRAILTPANVVKTHAQYNTTSYEAYVRSEAARLGTIRTMLPTDAGLLNLIFSAPATGQALRFDGTALFDPATGGVGGSLAVDTLSTEMEITGGARTVDFTGVSLDAASLNAFGAKRMWIGATPTIYEATPTSVSFSSSTGTLIVRNGAVLRAPEVLLVSGKKEYFTPSGLVQARLVVEAGAEINTIGQGAPIYDSTSGIVYTPGTQSVIAVSNGWLNILPTTGGFGGGRIEIGLGGGMEGAKLYSEGTIGFATSNTIALADTTRYGGKYLSFAMNSINIGEDAALAAAATAGVLPTGLTFNQATLARLLAGNRGEGVPAIESLTLTARNSVNFFGSVTLDATVGALDSLVLNTPAVYGLGGSGDVASLKVENLYWDGVLNQTGQTPVSQAPGAVLPGGAGTGSGRLKIDVDSLMFGYSVYARPNPQVVLDKLVVGFATVDITAKERISANNNGTLKVYQTAGAAGAPGTGGALNLVTPLLTGEAASVNRITAGGALTLTSQGAGTTRVEGGLGAEIALKGASVTVASDIVLPAGRLTLSADGDIRLASNADLDLSGRFVQMYDQVRATPGGDVIIESAHGNVVQEVGSSIDLSAQENQAGTLSVTALDAAAGHVNLGGTILGSATGVYDAGGTMVPWLAGDVLVRAQTIDDFVGLNARLTQGGVFGARSFQIKQGNLVIGDELKATSIIVSVDGGSLTVNGKVDASGERVGTIRLSARDGLTLASTAVLDAHGTKLRVDSYGKPIDASNRAVVELTSTQGMLTLSPGATIDVRSADNVARGSVTLNAPRVGTNDIAVSAAGSLNIRGARTIALNAVRSYTPGNGIIDQAYLDGIHLDSAAFIDAALLNGALRGRIAGLTAYSNAFHLRPGVEITSTDKLTVQGDLDLSKYRYNSLNPLSQKTSAYGSGEAAALAIRAGGNLDIKGSINDGFAPPPGTPDDKGWVVTFPNGVVTSPFALPAGATVPKGATFASGTVLDFNATFGRSLIAEAGKPTAVEFRLSESYTISIGDPLPMYSENWDGFVVTSDYAVTGGSYFAGDRDYVAGDIIPAGTFIYFALVDQGAPAPFEVILAPGQLILPGAVFSRSIYGAGPQIRANIAMPTQVTLGSSYTLTTSLVATGTIVTATRTYAAGETIPAGTVLASGTTLGTGTILPFAVEADSVVWPKGVPLAFTSSTVTMTADTLLDANATLPTGTTGVASVSLRNGQMWAVAPMLAPGSQSWSLRLAAGADIDAADSRAVRAASSLNGAGNITLDDLHYVNVFTTSVTQSPALSVIRTGTGDLELLAGGNYRQNSLFGVYTGGTQSAPVLADDGTDPYNLPRGTSNGSVLGTKGSAYESLVNGGADSVYQAWYPEQGGNVLLSAQGDVYGYIVDRSNPSSTTSSNMASNGIGNWLWRQGGAIAGQETAWWINFGTYVLDRTGAINDGAVQLVGFSGIGALGGGNVTVRAGGNAGVTQALGTTLNPVSQGLDIAIGGTGRVTADGNIVMTGGGDLTLKVGGELNGLANNNARDDLNGTITNLRGAINVSAGSIGRVDLSYGAGDDARSKAIDPRVRDLFEANVGRGRGGLVVAPGDATVHLSARRDVVLAGASDPGRVVVSNTTPYTATVNGVTTSYSGGGVSGFTLWTDRTAIDLLAVGGNLTPTTQNFTAGSIGNDGLNEADKRYIYPSILRAVAAEGSIYYGGYVIGETSPYNLVLAPSPRGQLELLAGGSIYAGGYAIDISGADTSVLATPFNPAFVGYSGANVIAVANMSRNGPTGQRPSPQALFAFGADTITTNLHLGDDTPALIYAVNGDIVGFYSGSVHEFPAFDPRDPMTWRVGAKPTWIRAGRDIVGLGSPLNQNPTQLTGQTTAGLIVHSNPDDISIVSAGRDVLYANIQVAGPGMVEVSAGRNIYQADKGSITSIGPLASGDSRSGASILMQAGIGGATGPDYAALAARYLDPANLAVAGTPLVGQTGKVAKTYEQELAAWLGERFGFKGNVNEARSYFAGLPAEQQHVFLRQIYFAELREGGREYNNPGSPRFRNYIRGREAIATLFPEEAASGNIIERAGDIIMFGGSGVRTNFGGDIQMLAPGGQIVVGVEGQVPPASAGVLTLGSGGIQMYSQGSILLGLSRIMTTMGGDILAWSAEGDINAGRGAKTTIGYVPPRRVYDDYGMVTLSPNAPASGAGISARSAIPGILSGNVDLIAPLGTIDIGEAGVSGRNVNLAALQIVNAANIQAQGNITGVPTVQAPPVAALATSNNMTAATQQAQPAAPNTNDRPSIIIVEFLGFGGGSETPQPDPQNNDDRRKRSQLPDYDPNSAFRAVGNGKLTEEQRSSLTARERINLDKLVDRADER